MPDNRIKLPGVRCLSACVLCLCLVLLCIAPIRGTLSYVVGVSSSVVNTFYGEEEQAEALPTPGGTEEDTPSESENPVEDETPAETEPTEDAEELPQTDTTPTESDGVKTGDESHTLRYIIGAVAAAMALVLIWTRKPGYQPKRVRRK